MTMKSLYAGLVLGALSAMALAAPAGAADGLSASGDVGVFSQYVWRGLPQSTDGNGASNPAVQGDVSLAYGGWTLSGWFSNAYPSPAPQYGNKTVHEFDWTLDYSGSVGAVGWSVGGIYYTYLYDSASNFAEVYAGIRYDAAIRPSLTLYYSPRDSHNKTYLAGDAWIDVGLSSQVFGADLSAVISYARWKKDAAKRAEASTGALKNGFNLVTLSLSRDFTASTLTITPSFTATVPIGKKAADGNRYIYNVAAKREVVFGVNVAF